MSDVHIHVIREYENFNISLEIGTSFCGLVMEGRIFYAQFTLQSPPTLKAQNHIIFLLSRC